MKILTLLSLLILSTASWGRSYVIFSMTQDLPMGIEGQVIRKNYYINMGSGQGIKKDSVVDVFRIISVQNPYNNKNRENFKVKIGELKVIHSSDNSAIATVNEYVNDPATPIFEIPQFMIGDHVAVSVN
mgnify:CR=1 FL=1